jgi:hypothetical protein
MKMQKSTIAAAVAATMGVTTADAASITTMVVTNGYFGMGQFTNFTYIPFTGLGSDTDLTSYSSFSSNGTAQPTGAGGTCAAGTVGCFDFGAAQVNTFMAASSSQSGVGGGGPTLSGEEYNDTGGTTNIDTSGYFANWNGTDFNQGNTSSVLVTSNCTAGTCDFTASWTSFISGGPFDGNTGCWFLQGTVSSIPVPAAAWLMGSGLVGLVGVARRKRNRK